MNLSFEDVVLAQDRIAPYITRTPVLTSTTLNHLMDANLFFKCEIFQKTGAFKFRGACNAVFSLTHQEAAHGVATHSSGNHAAALSLAAKKRTIKAYIVMPENSSRVKRNAVKDYGATITFCESTIAARVATLKKIIADTHANFIHPYDDERIMAGQGTVALELNEQIPDLDIVVVPVGGGGLIAGIATIYKKLSPKTLIIGAEPVEANDVFLSFQQKSIHKNSAIEKSVCDGLLVPLGEKTAPIIFSQVDNILTAREETIIKATQLIMERMKLVVEPSAAISLAVIMDQPELFKHKKVGLILSGGNVDLKAIVPLF